MAYIKAAEEKRLRQAEEVCFCLILMMALGGLDIPQDEKDLLAEPMLKWADLAADAGLIREGDESEL